MPGRGRPRKKPFGRPRRATPSPLRGSSGSSDSEALPPLADPNTAPTPYKTPNVYLPRTKRPYKGQTREQKTGMQRLKRLTCARDRRGQGDRDRATAAFAFGDLGARKMVATAFPQARHGVDRGTELLLEQPVCAWPGLVDDCKAACVSDLPAVWDGMMRNLALQKRLDIDESFTLTPLTGPPTNQLWLSDAFLGNTGARSVPVVLFYDAATHHVAKVHDIPDWLKDVVKPEKKKAKCNLLIARNPMCEYPHSGDARQVVSVNWGPGCMEDAMEAAGVGDFLTKRSRPTPAVCGAPLCRTHSQLHRNTVADVGTDLHACPLADEKDILVPIWSLDGAEIPSLLGTATIPNAYGNQAVRHVDWKGGFCPFHGRITTSTVLRDPNWPGLYNISVDVRTAFKGRLLPCHLRHILQVVWCPDHLAALHVAGALTNTLNLLKGQNNDGNGVKVVKDYLPAQSNLQKQASDDADGKTRQQHFTHVRQWMFDLSYVDRVGRSSLKRTKFEMFLRALAMAGAPMPLLVMCGCTFDSWFGCSCHPLPSCASSETGRRRPRRSGSWGSPSTTRPTTCSRSRWVTSGCGGCRIMRGCATHGSGMPRSSPCTC